MHAYILKSYVHHAPDMVNPVLLKSTKLPSIICRQRARSHLINPELANIHSHYIESATDLYMSLNYSLWPAARSLLARLLFLKNSSPDPGPARPVWLTLHQLNSKYPNTKYSNGLNNPPSHTIKNIKKTTFLHIKIKILLTSFNTKTQNDTTK